MNIVALLNWTQNYLKDHHIHNYKREAEDLVSEALHLTKSDLFLERERILSEDEITDLKNISIRRGNREPLAYIFGKVEFYDVQILLTRDVLIPRQETELLVDLLVKNLQKQDLKNKILVDVCTGSGCIAIALKKRFPKLEVIGIDLSSSALEIAKKMHI